MAVKFSIHKNNFRHLSAKLNGLKKGRKSSLEIYFLPEAVNAKIIEQAFFLLQKYEKFFQIRIKGLPYCLMPETEDRLIFNEPSVAKIHLKACQNCRYKTRCGGILKNQLGFYKNLIKPVKDLPREVMIELEPHCNFNCVFCFNKNSFAKNGRNNVKAFTNTYVKKIIRAIAESGVKIVRFTGGEPMLRKDLWDLMDFAKEKGLKIRLNTNGSLINNSRTVKDLNKYISSILLPIDSYDNEKESELTGHGDSLKKKIKAVKLLKKYGQMTVRAGTVAVRDNIANLEKIFTLVVKKLDLDDWEVYRPIPSPENKFPINQEDFKALVDKLLKFQKQTGRIFNVVNAVPFCAYDPQKVNKVSNGALSVDGHIRYAIDPRGFAKPDYYIDKNIGDPLNIKSCWNHPFMKKMRNLKFAPKKCKSCKYLEKCRGGSRFAAKMAFGKYDSPDPLMPLD
jgi:radical SAM protein with 4Fe4S-binding SPASM domain